MVEIVAFVAFFVGVAALRSARRTADRLESELAALKQELQRIEASSAAPAGVASQTPNALADETAELPVASAVFEPAAAAVVAGDASISGDDAPGQDAIERASRGEPAAAASVGPAAIDAVVPRPKESLESRLGARWAVWVGGIALALGGIFMVKYSIDAGLLSPAVRLSMAAVFGLVLMGIGEVVRRRSVPLVADAFQNAMIPGILTAAGAVTLFGVSYAAHGVYGFIGPVTAFLLLSAVSLATVGLSLLHGQALAGLGLLASLITPALVSSQAPSPWSLFGFLAIAWMATYLAARIRRWSIVPSLANIGLCLWALVYILSASPFEPLPVTLVMLLMLAGVGLIWPGVSGGVRARRDDAEPKSLAAAWKSVMAPPFVAITATAAVSVMLAALGMVSPVGIATGYPIVAFCGLTLGLAALGALRGYAVYAALAAAFLAIAGIWSTMSLAGLLTVIDPAAPGHVAVLAVSGRMAMMASMLLSAAFIALGIAATRLHLRDRQPLAAIWCLIVAIVPVALTAISWAMTGNLAFDPAHGLFAAVLGLVLIGMAEWLWRHDRDRNDIGLPQAFVVAGSLGLFVIALFALTDGLATTVLIAILGSAYALSTRSRAWPALPWMMVGASLVVLARIAWDPTIVGPQNLGTTPVFNALLAGYGIPAVLLVLSAFDLRQWPDRRVRNLLQALATLLSLLTAAILVRHAMNHGVLDSASPTLGEQSIYTLLAIGASGILMTLDLKSPSPVFRYGGMAIGIVSMLSILGAHLIGLNPYFSGELLGSVPFFDLLLIGYLLPGLGYAGLSWYARGRRPQPYVIALAVSGAVLVFAWATLSVRRFWQGPNIADWKGFLAGETYTYSVIWLLLGVLLLALGSRFNAKSIRIASAVLVFVAVLKVFLIDMANLEGFLRALSFIGLGAVLIGIGLFYQKILSGKVHDGPQQTLDTAPEPGQTG